MNRKSQMVSEAVEEVLNLVDKANITFEELVRVPIDGSTNNSANVHESDSSRGEFKIFYLKLRFKDHMCFVLYLLPSK